MHRFIDILAVAPILLAPNKRHELAQLGIRPILAATMANLLSASIVGLLL